MSAISTARLRGPGIAGRISPVRSPNRSLSAEKASGLSAEAGWQDSTLEDRPAARRTCCHTTVLPIPASPVITSAAGSPDTAERNAKISVISGPLPISLRSTRHPPDWA